MIFLGVDSVRPRDASPVLTRGAKGGAADADADADGVLGGNSDEIVRKARCAVVVCKTDVGVVDAPEEREVEAARGASRRGR